VKATGNPGLGVIYHESPEWRWMLLHVGTAVESLISSQLAFLTDTPPPLLLILAPSMLLVLALDVWPSDPQGDLHL
jgi:hypothetical protein